jgi:hypothetical protein
VAAQNRRGAVRGEVMTVDQDKLIEYLADMQPYLSRQATLSRSADDDKIADEHIGAFKFCTELLHKIDMGDFS